VSGKVVVSFAPLVLMTSSTFQTCENVAYSCLYTKVYYRLCSVKSVHSLIAKKGEVFKCVEPFKDFFSRSGLENLFLLKLKKKLKLKVSEGSSALLALNCGIEIVFFTELKVNKRRMRWAIFQPEN